MHLHFFFHVHASYGVLSLIDNIEKKKLIMHFDQTDVLKWTLLNISTFGIKNYFSIYTFDIFAIMRLSKNANVRCY